MRKTRTHTPDGFFRSAFKFAIVRNPWDWHYSFYNYILGTPDHKQREEVESLGDFRDYLRWRTLEKNLLFQKWFICDDEDRPLVDFIGKFETLERDFKEICSRIGVQASLPHLNKNQSRDYRAAYDVESWNLVHEHFADDIKLFGYEQESAAK